MFADAVLPAMLACMMCGCREHSRWFRISLTTFFVMPPPRSTNLMATCSDCVLCHSACTQGFCICYAVPVLSAARPQACLSIGIASLLAVRSNGDARSD